MKLVIKKRIVSHKSHLFFRAKWMYLSFLIALVLFTGNTFSHAANSPECKIDSLKAILAKKIQPADRIKTLTALSKEYYIESDLKAALNTDNQLFEVVSKYGNAADSALCFRLTGLVYMQMAWYDKALDYLMQALQIYKKTGDTIMKAKALMNIGTVHDIMGNLPMSLSYYNQALDYFNQKKNSGGIADCELNIAILLTKQKKYTEACNKLLSAAAIYEKKGNTSNLAAAYINLGLAYKKLNNYSLAIDYLNKAFVIWTRLDDQFHICYFYMNIGEIMLDLNRLNEAGKYLKQAEKLALNLGSKDQLATTFEFLSDYHAATKNYAQAYTYLNKSKQINDSILNAETTEKVNQIQYHYEIAKREAVNTHLMKQNLGNELQIQKKNTFLHILTAFLIIIVILVVFLVKQNRLKNKVNNQLEAKSLLVETQKDELIKLNASKDKFLSILAHDIKNPLSSILGLSDVLIVDYDKLTEEEKLVFTRDIHTLSTNLFDIINTLLAWSTSQSGMIAYRPKKFVIDDLCRQSVRNLQTVAKQKDILLVCRTDEKLSVLADENMILSVMHNLINNAIKYSYPGTSIRIETKLVDHFVQVSVIDSGIGLSPESLAKLFKYDQHYLNKGTAGEVGTGLGLILCKDFVEKNGGTISVDSQFEKGSTFVFTLPVA